MLKMQKIDWLLNKYGESHQNATNKLIHWVCVPTIVFSLFGLLYAIPFPFAERSLLINWATFLYVITLLYYFRMSMTMFLGMAAVCGAMVVGVNAIYHNVGDAVTLAKISFGIFAMAWVGQFIGHKIEGKKPSFLEDIQFLLVGPAWLLHFIYKKAGIRY
jgi:uncharacterized membrane protein YGL010W